MTEQATLRISDVRCGGCASTTIKRLRTVPGAGVSDADYESTPVCFSYDEARVSVDRIKQSPDDIGFTPEPLL